MKMKRTLLFIFAALCLFTGGCGENEPDGKGAYESAHIIPDTAWYRFAGNEYTINTIEELVGLQVLVANGRDMISKTIKLGADISLTVKDKNGDAKYRWTPIGRGSPQIDYRRPFRGTFDGNGHTISGVYVETVLDEAGLFGCIEGATIKNLGVTGLQVKGQNKVGGLVGLNRAGEIRNCYTTGKVEGGKDYVGGLVGYNDGGKIYDSYSKCGVSGGDYVGGLAGISPGYPSAITRCYSIGSVSGKTEKVGGLVGGNDGKSPIVNSYYNKETSGRQDTAKGEPKTTADMKKQITYLDWDFSAVWGIKSSANDGYPYLNADTGGVSQQYTVSFNSQSGTACSSIPAKAGDTITLPSTTREGYTFDGWYNASGNSYYGKNGDKYAVTGNITLYAHWTIIPQQYVISFDSRGGTACSSISAKAGDTITLPLTTREGFIFEGWGAFDSDGVLILYIYGEGGDSYVVTQNLTMSALWLENCQKPFAPDGVSASIEYRQTTHGEETGEPVQPLLPDYLVYVMWVAAGDVDSYEIYRGESENGTYSIIATLHETTAYYFEDMSIEINVTYWYKIKAINVCGESEFSAAVSASTNIPVMLEGG